MRKDLVALAALLVTSTGAKAGILDIPGKVFNEVRNVGEAAGRAVQSASDAMFGESRSTQKFGPKDCRATGESLPLTQDPQVFTQFITPALHPDSPSYRVMTSDARVNPGNIRWEKPKISLALNNNQEYTYRLELCAEGECRTRVASGHYVIAGGKITLEGLGEATAISREVTCTNDTVPGGRFPNGAQEISLRINLGLPGFEGNTLDTGVIVSQPGPEDWISGFDRLKGEFQKARQKKLASQYYDQVRESGLSQLSQHQQDMANVDREVHQAYADDSAREAMRKKSIRRLALLSEGSARTYPSLAQPGDDAPSFFVPPRSQW